MNNSISLFHYNFMRWLTSKALMLSLFSFLACQGDSARTIVSPLYFSVDLVDSTCTKVTLRFKLANLGSTPLVIYRARLPWSWSSSFPMIAIDDVNKDTLKHIVILDNPTSGDTTLRPHDTLIHLMSVGHQFPDLCDVLSKHRKVVILWQFQLKAKDGTVFPMKIGRLCLLH